MSPEELAKHILRNYETHELEEAITLAVIGYMQGAYEDAAKIAEHSNTFGASLIAKKIRQRSKEVFSNE